MGVGRALVVLAVRPEEPLEAVLLDEERPLVVVFPVEHFAGLGSASLIDGFQ